jgi:GcrA cell cycle regulator
MLDGRLERARALWVEGVDVTQIARRIGHGCTRHALIGKAHREGWPPHPHPPQYGGRGNRKLERQGERREERREGRKAPTPLRVTGEPQRLAVPTAVFRTCQWPRGERPDWRWCDAATVDGGPWCAEHKAVAWVRRPHAGAAEHGVRW